jgi:hypothetical protein
MSTLSSSIPVAVIHLRFRRALLAHTSALTTREVYAEKMRKENTKENTKEIPIFISAVLPRAQLSYRYMSAHLHTFPMHGIARQHASSTHTPKWTPNHAYQRHALRY